MLVNLNTVETKFDNRALAYVRMPRP
jgi:hypothetical protein